MFEDCNTFYQGDARGGRPRLTQRDNARRKRDVWRHLRSAFPAPAGRGPVPAWPRGQLAECARQTPRSKPKGIGSMATGTVSGSTTRRALDSSRRMAAAKTCSRISRRSTCRASRRSRKAKGLLRRDPRAQGQAGRTSRAAADRRHRCRRPCRRQIDKGPPQAGLFFQRIRDRDRVGSKGPPAGGFPARADERHGLHPLDHRLAEAGARHLLRAVHQAREVVGHDLVLDRLLDARLDAAPRPPSSPCGRSIICADRISEPGLT